MVIGMYGQSLLTNLGIEIDESYFYEMKSISLMEESFDVLNESAEISIIRKKISDLKNDPSKITKNDIDDIVNQINKQENKSAVIGIILYFLGVFLFIISSVISVNAPIPLIVISAYGGGMVSCLASIHFSINSHTKTSYSKLVKYEDKISAKIKKLKESDNQTKEVKDQIKELQDTYKVVEEVRVAFKKSIKDKNKAKTTK